MDLKPFSAFIGPSYPAASVFLDSSRTVNMYMETLETGAGRNRFALLSSPGTVTWATAGQGPIRAIKKAYDGNLYVVSRDHLYKITSAGVVSDLGSVGGSTAPASIDSSTLQVFVVSDGNGYIYTFASGVLQQIASAGFQSGHALIGAFVDGYFLYLADDNYFYISALRDGLTWSALDRATVESSANTQVTLLVDHREVLVFGQEIAQIFQNTGALFPFEPASGGTIHQGCAARFSPARLDNSVFWLGSDERGAGVVWRLQGYTPMRVSNHAVETAMQGYSRIDDAIAFAFQWDGHAFYRISFPTAKATWQYDVATNDWTEQLFWNVNSGASEAHLGQVHSYAFSKHLVGSRSSGKIYSLDAATFTDDGAVIRRVRRAPHALGMGQRIRYAALQLDLEPGLGLVSGQGADPTVLLRISDDGGKTFAVNHPDRELKAGKIGEYRRRILTHRLGSAYDRVFEIVMTDPIPWRITNAWIDAT